jgi:4-amino-4-deoxy-L-arabinose transferase-like glycosyltransferase
MLSIVASIVMLLFFYRLVRLVSEENVALWSTFILAILPLQIFYGRAFIPDMTMMMFVVAGVYFFVLWLRDQNTSSLLLSCAMITLASLMKLPALYVGFLFVFLLWRKFRISFLLKPSVWAYAIVTLGVVASWYWHSHSNLTADGVTFGIWEYGSDKWGNWQMLIQPDFWNKVLFQSIAERHLTWIGFVVFLVGLFSKRLTPIEEVFTGWLVAALIYFAIVAKGNYVHEYYQLPIVPPAAFFIGKAFATKLSRTEPSMLVRRTFAIALVGIIALSTVRLYSYLSLEDPGESVHYQLATAVGGNSQPTDQIWLLGDHNPAVLYLSHRKGWAVTFSEVRSDSIISLPTVPPRIIAGMFSSNPDSLEPDLRAFLQLRDSLVITFYVVRDRS